MAKRPSTVFVCQECGSQSPKWLGRCADCGAWNSFVEERPLESGGAPAAGHRYALAGAGGAAQLYADIKVEQHARLTTGIDEFDRVLGGGVVPGSLVLLGGEPGIGKSTLLLQAAASMARTIGPVLYSSGEESEHQIKSRGERLAVGHAPLYLLAETLIACRAHPDPRLPKPRIRQALRVKISRAIYGCSLVLERRAPGQHVPSDGPVEQARVEVRKSEVLGDASAERALAGCCRSVDGDDHVKPQPVSAQSCLGQRPSHKLWIPSADLCAQGCHHIAKLWEARRDHAPIVHGNGLPARETHREERHRDPMVQVRGHRAAT